MCREHLTPSEKLILRTLLSEYLEPSDSPEGYGPYGRAAARLGVRAYRVASVEMQYAGMPGQHGYLTRLREAAE